MNEAASPSHAKESLRRQFSWTMPANAIYGACNLLLLVVINKLGSPSAAGQFSLALAVTAPIFLFASLRFSTILASDMRPSIRLADYFQLRLLLVTAMVIIVSASLLPSSREFAVLLVIMALVKAAEAISDLCCGVQQRIERVDRIALSLVANGLAMIGIFGIAYFWTRQLSYAALGLLAARVGVLAWYDIPAAWRASTHPVFAASKSAPRDESTIIPSLREQCGTLLRSNSVRAILFTAAPLGVTAALLSLCSNIPRYIIALAYGDDMLGRFCSVAVVLQAGTLIFRAVEQPVMPRIAGLLAERNAEGFWRLLALLLAIFLGLGLTGCVLGLLIGPDMLSWVFTPAYRSMGGVLALMAIATAIAQVAGMIESSLIAARLTAIQMPMHLVTVLSCLLLSLWWIPQFELYGAVLAVAICRFPFIVVGVLLLRRKLSERPSDRPRDASERKAA